MNDFRMMYKLNNFETLSILADLSIKEENNLAPFSKTDLNVGCRV